MLLPSEVVDFGPHDFILLPLNLVFHQFFLFVHLHLFHPHVLVLLTNEFSLLGLFLLMKVNCILDFSLLHISSIFHVNHLSLVLFLPLLLLPSLAALVFCCDYGVNALAGRQADGWADGLTDRWMGRGISLEVYQVRLVHFYLLLT